MPGRRPPRAPRLAGFPGTPRPRGLTAPASPRPVRSGIDAVNPVTPPGWTGTTGEWLVYSWLRHEEIPFSYGGQAGPAMPDASGGTARPAFLVRDRAPGLVLEVAASTGYLSSAERAALAIRRAMSQAVGLAYVGLLASDLRTSLDDTMRAALDGAARFV